MLRKTFVVIAASTAALLSGVAVSATNSPFPASEQDGAPPTYLSVGAALPGASSVPNVGYFEDAHMRAERGPLVDNPVGATGGTARRTARWGIQQLPTATLSAGDD